MYEYGQQSGATVISSLWESAPVSDDLGANVWIESTEKQSVV